MSAHYILGRNGGRIMCASPDEKPEVAFCSNCGEPMALETSHTDENGQPIDSEFICAGCERK